MSMQPFNGDIKQALKWLQNEAPNIQSLISKKSDWYKQYHEQFWADWEKNIFDLRTANAFGCMVWCVILGVPSSIFGLYPDTNAWGFGPERQNFKYSGTAPGLPNPNLVGGNFYGGGNETLLTIEEVRRALRLRYVALLSNGRISFINRMLKYIFNQNQPWDFPNKKYFYVIDSTGTGQPITPTPDITAAATIEYRIGANTGVSAQLIRVLNNQAYGICPTFAGCKVTVIQET